MKGILLAAERPRLGLVQFSVNRREIQRSIVDRKIGSAFTLALNDRSQRLCRRDITIHVGQRSATYAHSSPLR